MSNPRIWQRLIWKDLRESWLILLLGIALPLALLPLRHQSGHYGWESAGLFLDLMLVMLWTASAPGAPPIIAARAMRCRSAGSRTGPSPTSFRPSFPCC